MVLNLKICIEKPTKNETFFYNSTEIKNSKEKKISWVISDNKWNSKDKYKTFYVSNLLKRHGLYHI